MCEGHLETRDIVALEVAEQSALSTSETAVAAAWACKAAGKPLPLGFLAASQLSRTFCQATPCPLRQSPPPITHVWKCCQDEAEGTKADIVGKFQHWKG